MICNRRNWFLTAGGILAATATPTKAYSFLFDNPLRDDAAWLSKQTIVDGEDLMIRSFCELKPGIKIKNSSIWFSESGVLKMIDGISLDVPTLVNNYLNINSVFKFLGNNVVEMRSLKNPESIKYRL